MLFVTAEETLIPFPIEKELKRVRKKLEKSEPSWTHWPEQNDWKL